MVGSTNISTKLDVETISGYHFLSLGERPQPAQRLGKDKTKGRDSPAERGVYNPIAYCHCSTVPVIRHHHPPRRHRSWYLDFVMTGYYLPGEPRGLPLASHGSCSHLDQCGSRIREPFQRIGRCVGVKCESPGRALSNYKSLPEYSLRRNTCFAGTQCKRPRWQ